MAPDPQCAAVAAAKEKSGLSYAAIASQIGKTEQEVIDIVTAKKRPTKAEFDALAKVLKITAVLPQDASHATA